MDLSNIYILNIKNADYHCLINRISKSEAIKLLQNIDLTEKSKTLPKNKYQQQFWNCKFTSHSNLNKKNEKLSIKKNINILKVYRNMERKNCKIWWYWNQKTKISPTQKIYLNEKYRY